MTNYFRQLTLPWLIALSLMLLFTALWYHYESKIMQRAQVQQFTSSLQFSIRPLLASKNPDLLKAQLNHLRYASVLPVSTIAVYSDTGRLISGTDKATLLPQFQPEQMQQEFQLLHEAGKLMAIQPMSSSAASSGYEEVIAGRNDDYYVVVQLEAPGNYSVWLVPVLVVAMLGWATLLIVLGGIGRVSQRQQTDISLLVHKLSQLKQGQLNSRLDDELVAELTPLKTALNELAGQQLNNRSRDDTEKNQFKQQITALTQSLTIEKQQSAQLHRLYEQNQLQQQQQLSQLRQLVHQPAVMPQIQLKRALHSQLMLVELTLATEPEPLTPLLLTEYLGRQLPHYRSILAEQNLALQLNEAPANALYQVALPENLLTTLLTALLRLSCHSEGITELTLTIQLSVTGSAGSLLLSVTGNGDGLLAPVRQQLVNPGQQSSHWQNIDSQIVTQIAAKLDASIDVQSLEGLGSTVSVRFSSADCQPVQVDRFKHVLLFDPQLTRLAERKAALGSLVTSVAQCADLSELQLKAKQHHYDAVLIFLPEPTELTAWLELIQALKQKTRVLCYAGADCIQMWREALGVAITAEPFCLDQLQQIQALDTINLPKLLVVDDNPTNLAFIQMLLKQQPLELSTANCAQQALQLCAVQQFDVILLDIQLPDMHGTEVAKQLRQMEAYQLTPILAFTAHALADEVASFKAAGMNDVIFKPLEVNKLQQILHWCSSAKTDNTGQ
ncbi:response regulator [Rheinheimera hassiensis]|uniref:response regulator n=1 Tax=Rheinheimera hassiensis TaxID=1193627 RepID=UPI001F059CE0|nr:response regulator [Rheinheimera hassiensis]